jgi:hypothetical protein
MSCGRTLRPCRAISAATSGQVQAQEKYRVYFGTYGKGIYQESIAVLAPGCLEQVIESVAAQIAQWS